MRGIIFTLVLFGNLWIWRIFSFSIILGVLTILSSFFLFLSIRERSTNRYPKTFIILFCLLLFFQWKTTDRESLTQLSNDQQRIQAMRLREYPPVKFSFAGKTIWIPIAHWFEGRQETIAFFRILTNFSEVVDPNLYFFANHPRERVGFKEFEKLPYLMLPFFVYGVYKILCKSKKKIVLIISFVAPVLLVSFIGNRDPIGPFSIFPFLVLTTAFGLDETHKMMKKLKKSKISYYTIVFLIICILVLLQIISYEFN